MAIALASLATADTAAVEALLDQAFGSDRKNRTAYRLRIGATAIPDLSFGLFENVELIGSIQCWPVKIGAQRLALVGPVAIAPEHQNTGHGGRLMRATLDAASTVGEPAMVMVGDPEYYQRFGFTAESTGGWKLPGPWEPRRLLSRNAGGHPLPAEGMLEQADAL